MQPHGSGLSLAQDLSSLVVVVLLLLLLLLLRAHSLPLLLCIFFSVCVARPQRAMFVGV